MSDKNTPKNDHPVHAKNPPAKQSNFELLRIISMVLIVAHHFSYHGVLKSSYENGFGRQTLTIFLAEVIESGGKIGVTLFVMITGYFMIHSKINLKKLVLLILQVSFYSIGILLLFKGLGFPISLGDTLRNVFPIIYGQYWFMTTYIVLYLFTPFLNKLLISLNKIDYLKLIFLMIFLWILIPTFTKGSMGDHDITRFLLFYSIGAYIKLYPDFFLKRKMGIQLTVVSCLVIFASIAAFNFIGERMNLDILIRNATFFTKDSSLFILAAAVGLFIWFKTISIGSIKWINTVSGATLGVYLFHDNEFIRSILWQSIFHTEEHLMDSPFIFVLYAVLVTVVVYLVSTLVELTRQIVFQKTGQWISHYDFNPFSKDSRWLEFNKSVKSKVRNRVE
ncbi:acyltransferase [Desemzia sp. FAM 23989]|uniref:acyltransferase n=1 Tax=Desemzia sp. FAM 23989 TaxID=3259523 RepID=UPI003888432A